MAMNAAINWQDGTLRLYSTTRVSKEDYKALREHGFNHRRGETDFKAAYTPERESWLTSHFELALEDDATDIADEAQARAERYEGYSDNAGKEARARLDRADQMASAIPMGQPILVGHHSEKRDRNYRKRMNDNIRKGLAEKDRSDYWARRAETALRMMEKRETAPAICRRIEALETDLRKLKRWQEEYPDSERNNRWIWFEENRLAFERALLAAVPDEKQPLTRDQIKKGGLVKSHGSWVMIERVNQKTVSYTSHGCHLKMPITDITPDRYTSPEEAEASRKSAGYRLDEKGELVKETETFTLQVLEDTARLWREAQYQASQANNAAGVGRATRELERLYLKIDELKAQQLDGIVSKTAIIPVSERRTVREFTFRHVPAADQPPAPLSRPASPDDVIGIQHALPGFASDKRLYLEPEVFQQRLL